MVTVAHPTPHANDISIGPAVFAGYLAVTSQTDRQTETDKQTDRPHHMPVAIGLMQPNKCANFTLVTNEARVDCY